MSMKNLGRAVFAIALVSVASLSSYTFKVVNATPFIIEASCEKVGVIKTSSVTIAPNDTDSINCGGADCINGIKVLVKGSAAGWKDVTLHSTWTARCRDLTAHVLAQPHYKRELNPQTGKTRHTVTGFKFSVSRNMAISNETEPFVCSQEL